ncbi:hemin uptake protein HemP [Pukyongiella litopenaei]|uniref:Hemin uptake protein HemP n=1 Tax=Pukyongiella litopenaei TaxID=2605946 RepID=A0A2S0MUE7_9RHOB|nr:hemin uptake protein HemP [Pukyongiella litopenaei]
MAAGLEPGSAAGPDRGRAEEPVGADEGASEPPADATGAAVPCWQAKDLTEGGQLARIRLGDADYMLRITRSAKLILTK